MLELILVILLTLVIGFVLLMLTSIFMAYATQAKYIDPLDGDETDD
jgi:hypothetical protein